MTGGKWSTACVCRDHLIRRPARGESRGRARRARGWQESRVSDGARTPSERRHPHENTLAPVPVALLLLLLLLRTDDTANTNPPTPFISTHRPFASIHDLQLRSSCFPFRPSCPLRLDPPTPAPLPACAAPPRYIWHVEEGESSAKRWTPLARRSAGASSGMPSACTVRRRDRGRREPQHPGGRREGATQRYPGRAGPAGVPCGGGRSSWTRSTQGTPRHRRAASARGRAPTSARAPRPARTETSVASRTSCRRSSQARIASTVSGGSGTTARARSTGGLRTATTGLDGMR